MLVERSLQAFSDETAARTPTPGGGSVVAAIGAFGAALGLMSARFTQGRKGFEEAEPALAADVDALESVRARLGELVDEDAAAFDGVGSAYGMPRGDDAQKAARKAAIRQSLLAAMEVPRRTCQVALEGLEVLDGLADRCNPNLASDVAVGAHALGAALRGAWVNVLVNLKGLRDEELTAELSASGRQWLQRADELERSIAERILAVVSP